MNSNQLNNAVLEILLHTGNSFDIEKVANESLISYIQQLDLSGIVLYEKQESEYVIHTIKPKNLKSNQNIFKIFNAMILDIDEIQKNCFDKDMPYENTLYQSFYYIYQIQDFGFLMFIKNNTPIESNVHKAIRQVNFKFTNSLISCKNLNNLNKQARILQRQSRLAQMGEMMSMIAHQWRQPLSAIGSISNNIIIKAELETLDNNKAIELGEKISVCVQHLSSTIDDFRDYFKPNKKTTKTTYKALVKSVLSIIEVSLFSNKIQLKQEIENEVKFSTYQNELKQVILSLIQNAEDILLEKQIEHPSITICIKDNVLKIKDNAGGIPESIIEKIFDPYFSTKSEKNGTGLGLYMSKTIIEEHCLGELRVFNDEVGAVFEIKLPLQ